VDYHVVWGVHRCRADDTAPKTPLAPALLYVADARMAIVRDASALACESAPQIRDCEVSATLLSIVTWTKLDNSLNFGLVSMLTVSLAILFERVPGMSDSLGVKVPCTTWWR
jgi:hypothetical protein